MWWQAWIFGQSPHNNSIGNATHMRSPSPTMEVYAWPSTPLHPPHSLPASRASKAERFDGRNSRRYGAHFIACQPPCAQQMPLAYAASHQFCISITAGSLRFYCSSGRARPEEFSSPCHVQTLLTHLVWLCHAALEGVSLHALGLGMPEDHMKMRNRGVLCCFRRRQGHERDENLINYSELSEMLFQHTKRATTTPRMNLSSGICKLHNPHDQVIPLIPAIYSQHGSMAAWVLSPWCIW